MSQVDLLSILPLTDDQREIEQWVNNQRVFLENTAFTAEVIDSFVPVELEKIPDQKQKFITAALLADWACYSAPADRAEYQRLKDVITTFSKGFRIWFCQFPLIGYLPVAYTGWYPMPVDSFEKVSRTPQHIKHRRELWPKENLSLDGDYVWIFNYSIVKPLQRSAQSKRMLQAFADDLAEVPMLGIATAVLSEASKRVVERFGMTYRGDMTHDDVAENIYAARFEKAIKLRPTQKQEQI